MIRFDELCNTSLWINEGLCNRRSINKIHCVREADLGGPFTFTRRFTLRSTEQLQESVIFDFAVWQLHCAEFFSASLQTAVGFLSQHRWHLTTVLPSSVWQLRVKS